MYDVSKIDDLREKFEAARTAQLDGQQFLSELELYCGVYPCYLWENFWLTGKATWEDMRTAFQVMQDDAVANLIVYFPHQQLAQHLVQTRQLEEAGVPFAPQFSKLVKANDLRDRGPLNKLAYMMEQIHEADPEDVDYFLTAIADLLQNHLILGSGNHLYRITELEFYYWRRGHADMYVHKEPEQRKMGQWFFNNADCLDFTFGEEKLNYFGGILLRGMQRLPAPQTPAFTAVEPAYIHGPRGVVRELIANLSSVFSGLPQPLRLENAPAGVFCQQQPWRVKRYGLRYKPEDVEADYLNRRYRFLVDTDYLRAMKDRAKVLQQLELPKEEAKALLGYYSATLNA